MAIARWDACCLLLMYRYVSFYASIQWRPSINTCFHIPDVQKRMSYVEAVESCLYLVEGF